MEWDDFFGLNSASSVNLCLIVGYKLFFNSLWAFGLSKFSNIETGEILVPVPYSMGLLLPLISPLIIFFRVNNMVLGFLFLHTSKFGRLTST